MTTPPRAGVLEISICPRRVALGLAVLVGVLVVAGGLAHIVIHQVAPDPDHRLARLMTRLDLGHEPSLPNWYSSLAMLAVAGVAGILARADRRGEQRLARYWACLSVLFVALAVDEAIMIHEMASDPLHELFDTSGIFYFAWVIPGALFVAATALFFRRFLFALEVRTRLLFLLAGALFVTGALGVEMLEGIIVPDLGVGSLEYTVAEMLEEGLEMLGVVVLLYALIDYFSRHVRSVYLTTPSER